ncbi:AMP-binding protein [Kutzneria albida]|uniref:Acyl-CoA synthetase n=1 Tax=Kutzneria albida DSM 43870 TaxID=1449976 RepID=W5WF68_9PSEU|nr:AMP-binding protein [Kutzneria albida]AHH99848.1 hypothetical protein KALB_6489 [Kutzneria albida DSM 43870]
MRKATDTLHDLAVLARAGMVGSPASLVRGVRSLLDTHSWGPVVGAARTAARRAPNATGLIDERGGLTFREIDERSSALARSLWAKGVCAGQVVAVLCRDHRGPIESLLACGKLGATTILLNTGFAAPQLAGVLRRERVSVLIYDEEFTETLSEVPPALPRILAWHDTAPWAGTPTLEQMIADAPHVKLGKPTNPAKVVLLTSGTTGTPKGAERQVRSGLAAADFLERIPLRAKESTYIASPLFHAIGFLHMILAMALSSTIVVNRRFDPRQAVAAVDRHSCTGLVLVPTMLQRVLELGEAELAAYDLSSLRVLFCSGSALPPALCLRALNAFGDVLYNFYGSTEVAVATVATPQDLRAAPGTVGHSPRCSTVRLYDAEGRPVRRAHAVGRVHVGNGLKFSGYTSGGGRRVINGLVDTGDLGHFDSQGRLFIDGRADDMIVSGGENVFPGEVENLLLTHYQVRDAAVIGVPDHAFGQRLRAYIVPTPGALVDPEEIKEFVRLSLARHKVPRDVVLIPRLPRTPTGKVIRRHLVRAALPG